MDETCLITCGPCGPTSECFSSRVTRKTRFAAGCFGADAAFLQKPFTEDALARKVRDVLDEGKEPKRQASTF